MLYDNGIFYIYRIYNLINKESYIGYTENPVQRFKSHTTVPWHKGGKRNGCPKFYNALRKYGVKNFSQMNIIDTCLSLDNALALEIKYIAQYDSYHNGYNSTPGGQTPNDFQVMHNNPIYKEEVANILKRASIKKSNLTVNEIIQIKQMLVDDCPSSKIKEIFHVSDKQISLIRNGKRFVWVAPELQAKISTINRRYIDRAIVVVILTIWKSYLIEYPNIGSNKLLQSLKIKVKELYPELDALQISRLARGNDWKSIHQEMGISLIRNNCGENNARSKLTNIQVKEIKNLISKGLKDLEISKMFGVDRDTIAAIRSGRSWKTIQ